MDRNLLKRRIREAYRLNKSGLCAGLQQRHQNLKLLIQYQNKDIQNFKSIEEAILKGMSKLDEKLTE